MTAAEDRPDSVTDVPVWRVGPPRPRQPGLPVEGGMPTPPLRGHVPGQSDNMPGEPRDTVIREGLVELALNGRTLVRASCLPAALDDFALGFLAGEGLIDGPHAVWSVAVSPDAARVEVRASVDPDRLALFLERLATSSGCGGGASAVAAALPPCASDACFRPEDICERMKEFEHASTLFRQTGGVHAAAVTDGRTLEAFAEDIGRHNAVDKVVGRCLREGVDLAHRAILSTGRLSSDILAKAARTGVPVVVSAGAVTSRAIELARPADIAAVGFARARRMNVYTAPWRLGLAPRGAAP
jgi:FdhD protein